MIWSPLLMKYQDGIVFQAACRDGVSNASVDALRCEAQSRVATARGRSLAKFSTKIFFFR